MKMDTFWQYLILQDISLNHLIRPGQGISENWKQALQKVVPTLLSSVKVNPDDVVGVCLSRQIDGVVLIDKNGASIGEAIIWIDRRATDQVKIIEEK